MADAYFDSPIDVDIRTRRPLFHPKEGSKDQSHLLERQRKAKLFKEFVAHPGYAEFRAMAYALCLAPVPTDLNSAIQWHFSAVRRSSMDMLFNNLEQIAAIKDPEDMPIVDGARPSFFADNTEISEHPDM